MQGIAATAGAGGVKLEAEIVPAEEPIEGALGVFVPTRVRGGVEGFEASRHHGVRLDRLLVEVGARFAAAVEAVTANRTKVAMLGGLEVSEPLQCLQTALENRRLPTRFAADDEGMGELGIIITQDFFEPGPIRLGGAVVQTH